MRNSYFDKQFFFDETGEIVGLCIGSDHCAEHERGINGLKTILNIPTTKFPLGLTDRIARPSEDRLKYVFFKTYKVRVANPKGSEKKTRTVLAARLGVSEDFEKGYSWAEKFRAEQEANPKFYPPHRETFYELDTLSEPSEKAITNDPYITAQWGEDGFNVLVWGEKRVKALTQIHQALLEHKLTVTQAGSSNPFKGRGLCLMLADKVSQETQDNILKADLDYKALYDEFEATGIEKLLSAAGKRYFALSPRRDKNGTLVFWLNPMEQRDNDFGWFTLEDLQDWAQGKGKIIKSKAA